MESTDLTYPEGKSDYPEAREMEIKRLMFLVIKQHLLCSVVVESSGSLCLRVNVTHSLFCKS